MPANFEELTCLDHDDLNRYAISLAATEYAHEEDDPAAAWRKHSIAHALRRLELAERDGESDPLLDELRKKASVPDTEEDEFRAHYLLRAEFKHLASKI